jgi:hypothetical protein
MLAAFQRNRRRILPLETMHGGGIDETPMIAWRDKSCQ